MDYRGEIVRIFAKNLERPRKPRPRSLTLLSEALMIRPYANPAHTLALCRLFITIPIHSCTHMEQ